VTTWWTRKQRQE
jgi:hypothetical protein